MKKYYALLLSAFALFACDDNQKNNDNKCTVNGKLDAGEECDGKVFAAGKDKCPAGQVGAVTCTNQCKVNTSQCKAPETKCGNNTIDAGEECDGNQFAAGKDKCPAGQTGAVTCTKECKVDVSQCKVANDKCGNNQIDAGEACDGILFNEFSCTDGLFFDKCDDCRAVCIDLPACGKEGELCKGSRTREYDYFRACPSDKIYVACDTQCRPTCTSPVCNTDANSKKGVMDRRWVTPKGVLNDSRERCDYNAIPKFACGTDKVGAKCTDGCALDLSACRDLIAQWHFGYRHSTLECYDIKAKGPDENNWVGPNLPKDAWDKNGVVVGKFRLYNGNEELNEIPGGGKAVIGSKLSADSEYEECTVRLSDLNTEAFKEDSMHFEVSIGKSKDGAYRDLVFAFTAQFDKYKFLKSDVTTQFKIVATSADKTETVDTEVLSDLKEEKSGYSHRVSVKLGALTTENPITIKVYPYNANAVGEEGKTQYKDVYVENMTLSGTKI